MAGSHRRNLATLILVTHDLSLAKRCARIIRMNDGRVIDDATSVPRLEVAAS